MDGIIGLPPSRYGEYSSASSVEIVKLGITWTAERVVISGINRRKIFINDK